MPTCHTVIPTFMPHLTLRRLRARRHTIVLDKNIGISLLVILTCFATHFHPRICQFIRSMWIIHLILRYKTHHSQHFPSPISALVPHSDAHLRHWCPSYDFFFLLHPLWHPSWYFIGSAGLTTRDISVRIIFGSICSLFGLFFCSVTALVTPVNPF